MQLLNIIIILMYRENLELMISLGDRSAQGRTYGNLGNTHYLFGDFSQAVQFHEKVYLHAMLIIN